MYFFKSDFINVQVVHTDLSMFVLLFNLSPTNQSCVNHASITQLQSIRRSIMICDSNFLLLLPILRPVFGNLI